MRRSRSPASASPRPAIPASSGRGIRRAARSAIAIWRSSPTSTGFPPSASRCAASRSRSRPPRPAGRAASPCWKAETAMKLKDQVAIVTGAGRNIGEDTAKLLASEGAKVAVVDMDQGRGDKVAAEIAQAGGVAAAFVTDVASEADIAKLVKDIVAKWGRIDILINIAAISDNKHVHEITKEQWDKVIAVTLTAPFLMSQHAARQMVAQGGGGKIVNIGSTSGFFGRSRAIA